MIRFRLGFHSNDRAVLLQNKAVRTSMKPEAELLDAFLDHRLAIIENPAGLTQLAHNFLMEQHGTPKPKKSTPKT